MSFFYIIRSIYTFSLYIKNNVYSTFVIISIIAFHNNLKTTNQIMLPKCLNYDMRPLVL